MGSVNTQATRSTLQSVDTTLSEDITATQDYIPVASTTNFSTSVVAEIESTNEVVSFTDISENRLPHSKNLNVSNGYSASGTTIITNQGPTPEDTNTASKITINTATSPHTFGYFGLSITSPTAFTGSYYVKNVSGSGYVQLRSASGGKNGYFANFDIVNGITGTKGSNINSSSITDVGNGWFRIAMTSNTTSHTLSGAEVCFTEGTSSLELPNFTGNGTDSYLIWGSQIELDNTLSTLLPTEATVPLFGLTGVTRGVNGTTAQAASSGDSIQQLPYALGSLDMPVRLRGISVSPDGTGAARLTLCDNNGDTLCDVDIPNAKSYTLNMPEDGIIFPNGVFVSNTDNITAYTVYTEKYSGPGLTS